jgi:phage terminase large subunit
VRFALYVTYGAQKARDLGLGKAGQYCWHVPLPSQVQIYEAAQGYLLWGGRAGPGKSVGARRWLYWRSMQIPGHEALLLRENWDQLKANHTVKMAQEVPQLGGRWLEGDRLAVFGKGSDQSLIYCGHMAETDAVTRYLGIEYGAIVADEASLYPVDFDGVPVLVELSTRARKTSTDRDGKRVEAVFVPVTNPGGPSAAWLRDMFIDHTPDFEKYPNLRPGYEDGVQVSGYRPDQWVYIAASLQDNPYMREDYKATVLANLSGIRYKQLADGDWDAFVGQFFREWDESRHVRRAVLAA